MVKPDDLTGKKYNCLLVVERMQNTIEGRTVWKCLCDCGNYTYVRGSNLKNGSVKSCGCLLHKNAYNHIHGLSKTSLYRKWISMKRRCYDSNDPHFENYGKRGIKVCDLWKNDFIAFKEWADNTCTDQTLTLERIDVNGDYCPENCTWVDRKAQANNRRTCKIYTYMGKTMNLTQWCNELNLDYKLIHNRIYRDNWSFEKAISTPVIKDGYAMRKWKEGG